MHVFESRFEVKKVSPDSGTFEGLASVYNIKDQGGDVVIPGAFKEFELTQDQQIRILDGHDTRAPIGKGKLTETPLGLHVKATLNMAVSRAREVFALLKDGIIDGLSIGYTPLAGGVEYRDGARYLTALRLFEISTVVFPMNQSARVGLVKHAGAAADLRELEGLLRAGVKVQLSGRKSKAAARALWPILTGAEPEADPSELIALFNSINSK